jgi:hypothetical protein
LAGDQELQLKVTLVDQASPQLKQLRDAMNHLNQQAAAGHKQARSEAEALSKELTKIFRQIKEVGTALGEMKVGALGGLPELFGAATRALGPLGVGIAGVGVAAYGAIKLFGELNEQLTEFANKINSFNLSGRSIGVSGGVIDSITEQMKAMGIGAKEGEQAFSNFIQTITKASRVGTPEWMEVGKFQNPQVMRQNIEQYRREIASGQYSRALTEAAQNINKRYLEELARTGSSAEATEKAKDTARTYGIPVDVARRIAERTGQGRGLHEPSAEEIKTFEDKYEKASADIISSQAGLQKALENVQRTILEKLAPTIDNWTQNLTKLYEFFNRWLGGGGGGEHGTPQQGSDLLKNVPRLANFADLGGAAHRYFEPGSFSSRLDPNLVGEVQDKTNEHQDALEENTDQLKRLNDFLGAPGVGGAGAGGLGLLSGGLGAGAGGGWLGGQGMPGTPSGRGNIGGGGLGGGPGLPSLPPQEGDRVGSGVGSGGRFNVPAGTRPIGGGDAETITLSNGEQVTVNKGAAAQFRGFFNDLIAAGAPVHGLGGVGARPGNPSQHPIGLAVDWAQSGRNIVSPGVQAWISRNRDKLNAIEQKWGMSGGEHWRNPDTGHFSVDTLFGTKHLAEVMGGQAPGGGLDKAGNAHNFMRGLSFLETSNDPRQAAQSEAGNTGFFRQNAADAAQARRAGLADPRIGTYEQQEAANWAYIQKFFPKAAAAIERGDHATAARMLSGHWVGLPGGSQPQNAARMAEWRRILQTASPRSVRNAQATAAGGHGGQTPWDQNVTHQPGEDAFDQEGHVFDRSAFDRAADPFHAKITGGADINVNVAAPPGTSVTAKRRGIFRKQTVSRQTQMQPAQSGPSMSEETVP